MIRGYVVDGILFGHLFWKVKGNCVLSPLFLRGPCMTYM